jgi:metal-dependent amidase/aminoacylase/carboxypeptidase family protein
MRPDARAANEAARVEWRRHLHHFPELAFTAAR